MQLGNRFRTEQQPSTDAWSVAVLNYLDLEGAPNALAYRIRKGIGPYGPLVLNSAMSTERLSRIRSRGGRIFVDDLEQTPTIAARFIGTEAANADRCSCCDLRNELDRLPALSAFFIFLNSGSGEWEQPLP